MIDFGQEQTVEVGGKRYTLARMKLRFIRPLKEYVRSEVGNPYQGLQGLIGELAPEVQREQLKRIDDLKEQLACFSLQAPLAQKFLAADPLAVCALVKAMLQPNHPAVTDDEAEAVVEELNRQEELAAALARAEGEPVKNSACPAG